MTASVRVTGDGGVPCPVAEYELGPVARVASSTAVPKRQPWGGPDRPQRSGYEIRAEPERQTTSTNGSASSSGLIPREEFKMMSSSTSAQRTYA